MRFTKMHGIGNDYVYINCFEEHVADPSSLAVAMSRRHFSVGSDGLVLIGPSTRQIFSACSTRMAARGDVRQRCACVGKLCLNGDSPTKRSLPEHQPASQLRLRVNDNVVSSIRVDMGTPELNPATSL